MANNPNSNDYMETWEDIYQICHYKTPAYKSIADESIKKNLDKGQKYHRSASSDFYVENMGGDGGYTNQAWSDIDQYIIINYVKDVSFYISKLNKFQAQLPLQIEYARKAMNNLFLQLDADVFGVAYANAGSIVDDGSLGGTTGNGVNLSVGNISAMFQAADTNLRLANVIYDPSATFSGDFKLDRMKNMPVANISAQVYGTLVLFLGGKTTELGDNVSNSGYVGKYLGFNIYTSNNLPWTGQLVLTTNPTDGDTFTLLNGVTQVVQGVSTSQALTYRFKTTPVAAGDVVIASTAALTLTNLLNAINNPYTAIATATNTGYIPFIQSSLTIMQQKMFTNQTATAATTTILGLQLNGLGNVPVSQSMTASGNVWTAAKQVQHCIFGVTKSISVVVQYGPYLEILQSNPATGSNNSGRVGWDFVTWHTYGIKVFNDQVPMLVDVQVRTDSFTTAPVNTF